MVNKIPVNAGKEMNTDNPTQILDLGDGKLEVTRLGEGRLALARLLSGRTTTEELIEKLGSAGITTGLIEKGLALIAQGVHDQIPVAASQLIVSEGHSTMPLFHTSVPSSKGEWLDWKGADLKRKVSAGELLIQVDGVPNTSLLNIEGTKKELVRGDALDASRFAGQGTKISADSAQVLADRSGHPYRTVFGVAAIPELTELPGIGGAHGKQHIEGSLLVSGDIQEGARAEVAGTLIAYGNVNGAWLEVDGNVSIQGGAVSDGHESAGTIRAGQSLCSKYVRGMKIWAGEDIHILEEAVKSQIQCIGTCVSPRIDQCEITVGARLVVHDMVGKNSIYLGPRHLDTPNLQAAKVLLSQHRMRLADIQEEISTKKELHDKAKESLVHEIERLRQPNLSGAQRNKAMQVLLRHYSSMNEALDGFKDHLKDYIDTADLVDQETEKINYYTHRLTAQSEPELVITGKVEPGTDIFGPSDKLTITEELQNVRISPNMITGSLEVQNL